MIYSMTGYAVCECEQPGGTLQLELRTVNHRYLELHLRLDDALRSFEPLLRETIGARLRRGKVECRAALLAPAGLAAAQLDAAVLQQLAQLGQAVQQHFPHGQPLSVAEVLRWPGVLASEPLDQQRLARDLGALLEQALDELAATRAREGEKLKALILERVGLMETEVECVRPLLPELVRAHQNKLLARLGEAMQSVDEERIRQELTLFAQKIDVDEELGRLVTHLQELRRILAAGGAVGKRLDFLMQELNREANTLGSKSVSSETSRVSMELKVLIEQIREQVQNIE